MKLMQSWLVSSTNPTKTFVSEGTVPSWQFPQFDLSEWPLPTARLGISEPKLNRFHAAGSCGEGDAQAGTCQAAPAAPSSVIKRRRLAACAPLRRMKRAAGPFRCP
jgi:hypothetical protein